MITLEAPSATHVFLFGGARAALSSQLQQCQSQLRTRPRLPMADLAAACRRSCELPSLAIVAATHETLDDLLARAAQRLRDPKCSRIQDAAGIYFTENPLYCSGHIAFLFPGEGAPFPGMLSGLSTRFPILDPMFAVCSTIETELCLPASSLLDCLTTSDPDRQSALEAQLHDFNFSLSVNVWGSWCLHQVLRQLGIEAQAVAGHSAGEATALFAARAVSDQSPFILIQNIARFQEPSEEPSGMLAVGAGYARVERILTEAGLSPGDETNIFLAMDNCPHQVVLVGTMEAAERAEKVVRQANLIVQRLGLPRPYHTSLFRPYLPMLSGLMASLEFQVPEIPIYSCATAREFPDDPHEILELAVQQWVQPVRFTELIQNMYEDGARIFVEVGPRANLTAFVEDILRGRPVLVAPSNRVGKSAESQMMHLMAQLAIHQVPVNWEGLYPTGSYPNATDLRAAAFPDLIPPVPVSTGDTTTTPPGPASISAATPASATMAAMSAPGTAKNTTETEAKAKTARPAATAMPSTSAASALDAAAVTTESETATNPLPVVASFLAPAPRAPGVTSRPARGRIRQAVANSAGSDRVVSNPTLTTRQQVVLSHQQLMQQFLQTQQTVIGQYLVGLGRSIAGPLPPELPAASPTLEPAFPGAGNTGDDPPTDRAGAAVCRRRNRRGRAGAFTHAASPARFG